MSLGTDYIIRYLSDISGAVKGAKQIETINSTMAKNIQAEFGQVTRKISDLETTRKSSIVKVDGKDAIQTLTTTGAVFETTSGKTLQLSKVTQQLGNDFKTVSVDAKNITSQFKLGNLEAEKGGKVFSNFMNTIKQLGGRALLTIPIWIALRGAIMGVFSGIQGGIQNLIAFDLALQKIRNNMQGTPQEVDAAFKKIRASITEASKATGISTEEIAGAVKQFATLGFSANESLQGALGASKLSIALFGDASDTAGAFARALNILIDRSTGAKSAIDQMNEAFALTSQLEETNNFEIKNVTEALDKFAGTAAGVGLTMNQTLAILAALGTAGRRGSEGATLLSTSFNQLLGNIPKISKSLGLVVGAGESTFSIFTKILDKITEINNTPGGQQSAVKAMEDIFGGNRGLKIVQSLIAVKDILDKNIATLPSFSALSQKAERTMNSESGQAKILGNNLKEMAKSFITALAGSEDFTGSLIKLNQIVTKVSDGLKPLGTTINAIFSNLGFIAGAAFLIKWEKTLTEAAILKALLKTQLAFAVLGNRLGFIFGGAWISGASKSLSAGGLAISLGFRESFMRGFAILGGLIARPFLAAFGASITLGAGSILGAALMAALSPIVIIAGILGKVGIDAFTNNFIKGIEETNDKAQAVFGKVIDGLKGQLSISDLTVLIEKLTLEQKSGDEAMIRQIGALRTRLQKQIEQSQITVQPVVDVQPIISFEEQQSISKILLANKLEELKLQGATNAQLAQAKILGTDQLKIKEDTITLLGNQLDLEKAIQEEKRLQNKLGSDSIKLFEISQTEGVAAAKAIGNVLSGETGFADFARRGGKNLEIFKKEFADIFKQQQALQFFTGERVSGEPMLRGGSTIAIQEEALRKQRPVGRSELLVAQKATEQQYAKITQVQTTIPVNINANIDVSKLDEVKKQFALEISKQLPQAGTDINNALQQALLGKQGNTL
jgi:TP901 family phage tail tape measure protein